MKQIEYTERAVLAACVQLLPAPCAKTTAKRPLATGEN
jgi:hypothetical protein